ncbi:DUF1684 domain-containing protein [Halodesulfurarchaeum sp. HSR-GB]|uniref:DUF1684 domain-containing protein n=1 Tax=Halodesulfurarchaeum sp. HSR-GB TaxID=3074077 RepID=UPI002865E4BD|nr:DUF1684 domain-containing protein [Halodesulfurarchaeum sp. HSR-GB]MDR5655883.1 DUF1684 domain-containing protein [Halodesulfurarchaeum sp. HSR-GB]
MAHEYEEHVREQRQQKEEYFAESPRSPIPRSAQADFAGLEYFAVDPSMRFEAELHEHEDPESLTVETTAGNAQEYLRWGEFHLEIDGETVTIQAYKGDPSEDRLWVPFRDETNSEETYGAGRYLDLERDRHYEDGTWLIDFNMAYNPTCAYNEAYECPLIPTENWLDVRIEAGEKAYPDEPHAPDR